MTCTFSTHHLTTARLQCLRGRVRVPVCTSVVSMAVAKDFIAHAYGGSDG